MQKEATGENRQTEPHSAPYEYGAGDIVYMSYQDQAGSMWFTTSEEGVYRFDGDTFEHWNEADGLCGQEVTSILQDLDGLFWFGTQNGLCKYDGNRFITIPLPEYPKQSAWLDKYYPMSNPGAVSTLLRARNGDLWVGSNCAGLYRYSGNQFKAFLQERGNLMPDSMHHNAISALAEDKDGHIWVGSFSHGGVSQYTGDGFIHHALKDGIGDGMISSIYIDQQERIWVGTRNGGIYRFDGESFVPLQQAETERIPMAKFFQDSRGVLWMSSYARRGVFQYDGAAFVPFSIPQSEQLVDIMHISEDHEGNIWFGGRYGILWRYDGTKLRDFTQLKRGMD